MDRHGRPILQRAPTSGSLHGGQVLRSGMVPPPRQPSTVSPIAGRPGLEKTASRHHLVEDDHTRASSRDSTRHGSTTGATSPDGQLYACPYAKHDPNRYSHVNINKDDSEYRNCSTGYWTSISRLKQHLYRTHDQSQRCNRCWKYYPTDGALREHKERVSCQSKPQPQGLMTAQQHHAISKREHRRPVESWAKIYQILFPTDELPGSVHPEYVTGEDLRTCFEWLDEELPKLLYREFLKRDPNARGTKPTSSTRFLTTAEIVQEAIEQCKESFALRMGPRMTPVFADEPLPTPRPRSHNNPQNSGVQSGQTRRIRGEESEDDSSSTSTTEMDVDEEVRRHDTIRRHRIEEESSRGQTGRREHGAISPSVAHRGRPGFTVPMTSMPITSGPSTYTTMPVYSHEELMSGMYINEDIFSTNELGDMTQYDWSQQ